MGEIQWRKKEQGENSEKRGPFPLETDSPSFISRYFFLYKIKLLKFLRVFQEKYILHNFYF